MPPDPSAGAPAIPTVAPTPADRGPIPGPRGLELWRLLPDLAARPLEVMQGLVSRYGDIVLLSFPLDKVVLLAHPDYIEHVLHHRHQAYDKRTPRWRTLRQIWGEGLLTADGDVWRRQRQRMQPAFHQRHLDQTAGVIVEEAVAIGRAWAAAARVGGTCEVYTDMMRFAVRSLLRAMFGQDIEGKTDDLLKAVQDVNIYINPMSLANLLNVPIPLRRWVTRGFVPYQRGMDTIRSVFTEIIQRRLRSDTTGTDLLGLAMTGRDDDLSETMTARQLDGEMLTLLMAGHETTGIASAWGWYLIAQSPAVERKLHAELETVLGGRLPTLEDLPRLSYARMVFQEAMRLYPPIWAFDRGAHEDDVIDGYRIPRGTAVAISPYLMHRHPKHWNDPERFDPERFAPEAVDARPTYAYLPFGGGPRRCIGMRFAMMEGPLMLATLAQSFTLEPEPGQTIEPWPRLNLPPRFGIRMRVRERQRAS